MPSILIFSFGIITGGSSAVWLGQLFFNQINYNFLYFSILAWIYIRIVALLYLEMEKTKINRAIIFAYVYFIPLFIILFLGFLRAKLSLNILSILGFLDLLTVLGFSFFENFKKTLLNIFLGTLFSVTMILITVTSGNFPWLETSSLAGIGYPDDFRDAAISQSWSKYGVFSHGIHGLLFYPYHSLSVFFSEPFTSEKISIFQFFTYSSMIFVPTILCYGVWSMLNVTSSRYTKPYLPLIFFCFIFLFIGFNSIFNQRSVQIASLLYICAVPLLAVIWTSTKENILAFVLLAVLIPLVLFARIFHGLVLAAVVYPLLIDPRTRLVPKIILAISAITTLMIIFLFFGEDPRNSGLRPENVILSLTNKSYWLIHPIILIFAILILGILLYRKKKTLLEVLKTRDGSIGIAILIVITTPFVISIKSVNSSDIFYTFLPAFFIFYVLIFSEDFFKLLRDTTKKIITNVTIESGDIYWKPYIKNFFILLIFLVCIAKYFEYLKIHSSVGIKGEIISWRMMKDKWNPSGGNLILFEDLDLSRRCNNGRFDPFCLLRGKILGTTDMDKEVRNSLPAKIGKKASDLAAKSEGVTAIYIPPDHDYWSTKYLNINTRSLYFIARWGIPLIAGAIPDKRSDFSLPTARENEGTLLSLLEIGGIKGLCLKASKVGVSNVVVFLNLKGVDANFYNCDLINKNK